MSRFQLHNPTYTDKAVQPLFDINPFTQQSRASPLCCSCIQRGARGEEGPNTAPGPLYLVPCGHIMCRSCLIAQYFDRKQPTTCSCGMLTGFPSRERNVGSRSSKTTLRTDDEFLLHARRQNIFSPSSPNYASMTAIIFDRAEARAVFSAVYNLAVKQGGAALHLAGLPPPFVFNKIDGYLASVDQSRLSTPENVKQELRLQIEDVLFWQCVRRPEAGYHALAKCFDTEDRDRDFNGVCNIVRAIRDLDEDIKRGLDAWDGVLEWCVGVMAVRWFKRFQ